MLEVDCEISDWRDEGVCTRQCGGGEQMQIREILTESEHGGECPTDLVRFKKCGRLPDPTSFGHHGGREKQCVRVVCKARTIASFPLPTLGDVKKVSGTRGEGMATNKRASGIRTTLRLERKKWVARL